MSDIEYIRQNLSQAEMWGQLAEECTELAQAALKMQRLYMPTNKPRKLKKEIIKQVFEEIGDVLNCLEALKAYADPKQRDAKKRRWARNIEAAIKEGGSE